MIRGTSDAILAVQHSWYFPFGGWDADDLSSAPNDETPSAPGFGHDWYFPFGGWDDDGMSSTAADEVSSGPVPDTSVSALSFTAAQCFLPFGGKPNSRKRKRKKKKKRRTPTEVTSTALPVCCQHFYFPFGGWDGDGLSSAPDDESPSVPDSGHDWYFPFGGWGDDGMSSALDDELSTGLDFHPPRYFPFGGWGDDGMSSTPSQRSRDPCNYGEFVVHHLPFGGVSPAISAGQVRHERLLAQQQQDTELSRLAMQRQNPSFISQPRPPPRVERSQLANDAPLTKRQRARLRRRNRRRFAQAFPSDAPSFDYRLPFGGHDSRLPDERPLTKLQRKRLRRRNLRRLERAQRSQAPSTDPDFTFER